MHEYLFIDSISETAFCGTLKKYDEEGWTPIWETYKEYTSRNEEYPRYKVLIQKLVND
ncbi:MAG: hypothetical protein K8E24_005070 [Methanobacterium paludis]|nr:hypothetical protein [Methanobacterium paludis]